MPMMLGLTQMALGGAVASGSSPPYTLPTPVLLEAFDSTTGWTPTTADVALETTRKVQGAGALKLSGNGVSGNTPLATKSLGTLNPATFGVIAYYINVDPMGERQITARAGHRFGRSGTYSADTSLVDMSDMLEPGGKWHACHYSEFSGAPTTSGTVDLRPVFTSSGAPYNGRAAFDCLMANAAGRPTIVFTFDDVENTHYSEAFPYMQAAGIPGTCYITSADIGTTNKLTVGNCQAMYAAGWDMACDGTSDGPAMTTKGTVAAAITDIQLNQTFLTTNSMTRAKDHMCFPTGATGVGSTLKQAAAMTGDGSTTVTLGGAPGTAWAVGDTIFGYGVPDSTTIVTVNSTTSFVLSNSIPVQTKAAVAVDRTTAFYPGKLKAALLSAGFKTGRTTPATHGYNYTRFGFGDFAMYLGGKATSGQTLAQLTALVDVCILRGITLIFYTHRIDGSGGINTAVADFQGLIDYVATKKAANLLDTLTITQLWDRDNAAVQPFG